MAEENIRGRFVWHELMTTDPEAAKAFYTKVVGWKTKEWEGPMPYSLWIWGDSRMGGLMELPREAREMGARPSWLSYIGTPDVDAAVTQAQELGAKVLMPAKDIPTIGRFAILQDPQGAGFAVFTPIPTQARPETDAGPGDFSWHELATTDLDAAW